MSVLYIDDKSLTLSSRRNVLEIRQKDNNIQRIPFHLLSEVIILSSITITAYTIRKLTNHHIRVIIIDPKQKEYSSITEWQNHGNYKRKAKQILTFNQNRLCIPYIKDCIQGKLSQQIKTIKQLESFKNSKQSDKYLNSIQNCYETILTNDTQTPETLVGLEGNASKLYFNWMKNWCPPHLDFKGRQKRPPKDPVNACLSLGYTLLYHQAASTLFLVGLDPAFGFLHKIAYNRLSLSCDLIEPTRPHLDRWVLMLLKERKLQKNHFKINQEGCLLGKAGRQVFYEMYEKYRPFYKRYFYQYSYKLSKKIENEKSITLKSE